MRLLMRIASNYKCSHRYCSFFPLLACSQLTLTAMGRATDARSRSPSLSNQIAREGSLPPMTNSNSSSKLARCLFKGWGLIDLPLRASNEGLLRPRVARAQKIIRLHPLLCSGSTGPTWVAFQESPISHTSLTEEWPGCPLLRASDEHIPIVRVPGAGGLPNRLSPPLVSRFRSKEATQAKQRDGDTEGL